VLLRLDAGAGGTVGDQGKFGPQRLQWLPGTGRQDRAPGQYTQARSGS